MAVGLVLVLLVVHMLGGGATGSLEAEGKEEVGGKDSKERRSSDKPEHNRLVGYDCSQGLTKVLKMPKHQDCIKGQEGRADEAVWEGDFAILQRRRTLDTKVLHCALVKTSFAGHCGFMSHWSFSRVPEIQEKRYLSMDECRLAHLQGKFLIGGVFHPVSKGLNSMEVVSRGSLIYDASSQTVSCTDEAGREGKQGEMHLKEELKMVVYQLTLGEAPARLRTDTERLVVTAGIYEGLELTPLQVRGGGRAMEEVTIMLDEELKVGTCPYSVIRDKISLKQFNLFGRNTAKKKKEFGKPIHSRKGVPDEELLGIALVGEAVAIKLEKRESLPDRCKKLSGSGEVYQTSHQDVLALRLDGTDHLGVLKGNQRHLDELQEDLLTASRLDLLAYHVSEAYQNLTRGVNEGGCIQKLEDLGTLLDTESMFKTRVLPAGEAVILSKCKYTLVEPAWLANWTDVNSCPKYLPVKLQGSQGGATEQRYLEPVSRFLYKASPVQQCTLSQLVPILMEAKDGGYVFFNGSSFHKQGVQEYDWTKRMRYFTESGINFWDDVSALGVLRKGELADMELFQEFSMYLTQGSKGETEAGHTGGSASGSPGFNSVSWIAQVKERMGLGQRVLEEGMEVAGVYHVWKMAEEIWKELEYAVKVLAGVGGILYCLRVVLGGLYRFGRAVCRKRSTAELNREAKVAIGWGCDDPLSQAGCIICSEVVCGSSHRMRIEERLEIKKIVQEMLDDGIFRTKDHLRDLVLQEGRRRASTGRSLEMMNLMSKE